jgi:hypothetical protein
MDYRAAQQNKQQQTSTTLPMSKPIASGDDNEVGNSNYRPSSHYRDDGNESEKEDWEDVTILVSSGTPSGLPPSPKQFVVGAIEQFND